MIGIGWLLRIKKFFARTEKEGSEEIILSGLREWLQFRSQELMVNAKLNDEAQKYTSALKDKRWFLECQLDEWQEKAREHAHVEEVIPLFRETRRLLDLLSFPDDVPLERVLAQNAHLEPKIHTLSQKIESSSFVHDFDFVFSEDAAAEGLNPLSKELLEIDAQRKAFDIKVTQSGYMNIPVINAKAALLEQHLGQIQSLEKELEVKKNRLMATDEKKLEKEKDLLQLKEQAKSLDIENLKKKQENVLQQIENNETAIWSFFSKAKPLLQQYKEIEPGNALASSYLEDSLTAFLQDERWSIKHVFDHLRALLKAGKLSLNQEAFITSLTLLDFANGPAFEQLRIEHYRLQAELRQAKEQIQHNNLLMKIDDAAYRLDHFTKQVEKLDEEISVLEDKVGTLEERVSREQEFIQNLIKVSLGRNVVIKV